jgi:ABC-2 type transport system permease protein
VIERAVRSRTSDWRLLGQQIRYQNAIFWRTPIAAFFTLAFPLMFLLVFTLVFGNEEIPELGVTTAQFYSPALAVFGAVSASYTNLAIGTAISRDLGILKRIRGTPLPPWIYVGGRICSATYIAAIATVLMLGVGVAFYGVSVYAEALPAVVVTFVVGVLCFAALGMLVAALAPSGDSAPAITNATLLPLAFISDVFIPPSDTAPGWISTVADIFPLKHFVVAFQDAFNPVVVASRDSWLDFFEWGSLAVMTLWGVGAMVLALRWFTWEPRGGERQGGRRKRRAARTEA